MAIEAVGILELTSVGIGMAAQDKLLKAGDVKIILARTICSGKYIMAVTGPLAEVEASIDAGIDAIPEGLIDDCVIPQIHPQVFKALGQAVELTVPLTSDATRSQAGPKALGVLETYSGVSILEGADAAAKAGAVTLMKIHLAMALGGKGYCMMAGSVQDVQTAIDAGAGVVRQKGLLVSAVTINGPSSELFSEYI
jgi:microcompartment protein CcmL/EutN